MYRLILISLFFFFACGLFSEANGKFFPVYDALLHSKKPVLTNQGLLPITMIYADRLWERGEPKDEPNVSRIARVAKKLAPGSLVCVDIEHWPLRGDDEIVQKSIEKYRIVAATIKRHNPTIRLGFYGILPVRDYWRAINPENKGDYSQWTEENDALESLAEMVDVIFPSLYTFYTDQEGWEKFAIENLKQARKYGKPVLPFLWPRYHNSNRVMKPFNVPGDYWKRQMMTCLQRADGIVLWGGWNEEWDPRAPWWLETVSFLDSLASERLGH